MGACQCWAHILLYWPLNVEINHSFICTLTKHHVVLIQFKNYSCRKNWRKQKGLGLLILIQTTLKATGGQILIMSTLYWGIIQFSAQHCHAKQIQNRAPNLRTGRKNMFKHRSLNYLLACESVTMIALRVSIQGIQVHESHAYIDPSNLRVWSWI